MSFLPWPPIVQPFFHERCNSIQFPPFPFLFLLPSRYRHRPFHTRLNALQVQDPSTKLTHPRKRYRHPQRQLPGRQLQRAERRRPDVRHSDPKHNVLRHWVRHHALADKYGLVFSVRISQHEAPPPQRAVPKSILSKKPLPIQETLSAPPSSNPPPTPIFPKTTLTYPLKTPTGTQNCFISAAFVGLAASLAFLLMVRWGKALRARQRAQYWELVRRYIRLGALH